MEQHEFWEQTRKKFDSTRDLSYFKTWDEVRSIPLYTEYELIDEYAKDIKQLLSDSFDLQKYQDLLEEPKTGHTEASYKSALYDIELHGKKFKTTGFRLKSLHHILTFEKLRGRTIYSFPNIVEFGAGIGDTARTILDQGYSGNYYVYDFPEIARISSYYLGNRTKVVSELPSLGEETLFIATWSLSEAPLELRDKVAQWVKARGASFLILFQSDFYGTSNQKYFIEEWPFKSNSFYRFMPLKFHPAQGGNWYMVGQAH